RIHRPTPIHRCTRIHRHTRGRSPVFGGDDYSIQDLWSWGRVGWPEHLFSVRGMERNAVFVDAGWLLAAAALDVLGTPFRDELDCDYGALVAGVAEFVDRHSGGGERRRTYWYGAAPGGA